MRCTNYIKLAGRQTCPRLDFGKPRPATKRVLGGLSTAPKRSALLTLQISAACDEYSRSWG